MSRTMSSNRRTFANLIAAMTPYERRVFCRAVRAVASLPRHASNHDVNSAWLSAIAADMPRALNTTARYASHHLEAHS